MKEFKEPEFARLLRDYSRIGGVLDYVSLIKEFNSSPELFHREAALKGIEILANRLKQTKCILRYIWDESKLTGSPIDLSTFWGVDDVSSKPMGESCWSIANAEGYKACFFQPPYPLKGPFQEQQSLFEKINNYILGNQPEQAEIYSWSTDWSNYFDAGHEWWGAYYWTIRADNPNRIVVIGASSSD